MSLDVNAMRTGLAAIAEAMPDCADELNTADGKLGDGDLGITMTRASRAVAEVLDELPEDLGQACMKCAQAVIKAASSSYGTLMGTGLMSAAKALKGRTQVPHTEVSLLLDGALQAMQARGKANLGDKTVLDALAEARDRSAGLDDPAAVRDAVIAGAQAALDAYREKPNKIGRARIWGEKSVGLDDPGMLAFLRVVQALPR